MLILYLWIICIHPNYAQYTAACSAWTNHTYLNQVYHQMHPTGSINQTFLDISRSAISVWALPYLQLSPLDFLSRLHTGRYWPLTFFRGSLDYLRQDKMEPILVFLVAFLLFILLITFTISSTSSHLNHQRKGRIFTPLHQNNLHPSSDTYRDKHLHE